MAQWVLWDDKDDRLLSVMRNLPPALRGKDGAQLAQLGYRERLVVQPEDYIPRFPELLGSSKFTLMEDGRVRETFPDADYSVEAVRGELKRMVRESATMELSRSDWYVIRSMELNTKIPEPITKLRESVRTHVHWIENHLDSVKARDLVDYQWKMPSDPTQVMVNGLPVTFNPTPPTGVPALAPTEDENPSPVPPDALYGTGADFLEPPPEEPEAEELAPRPSTTDGPVPQIADGQEIPHLDANDVPLVTVYAPNVEDMGPRPDQENQ